MPTDPGAIARPEPLAYFLTWTTYGSWLPGDSRGWSDSRGGLQEPNKQLHDAVAARMKTCAIVLTPEERQAVERSITAACLSRGWPLHAASCRTQHVHVVVTAPRLAPVTVLQHLKSWATRSLHSSHRTDVDGHHTPRWWTRGGSRRHVFGERDLEAVVAYVQDCQAAKRER